MKRTVPDPIPLLSDLVKIPSVSGKEFAALQKLSGWLSAGNIAHSFAGRNLVVDFGDPDGPVLLMNAHIDTVPVVPGWRRDPHGAEIVGDRLYGLGSNDNKASVAAMAAAVAAILIEPLPPGRLVFAVTCDEETGGDGLEWLRPQLPPLSQALLSEPTNFEVATAQRGLVRLTARAKGLAAHASRPWEGVNAAALAQEDIARLLAIPLDKIHPLLGRATLELTRIKGGTAANVLPGDCTFTLDGRPTPLHDNEYYEREIRAALKHSEIEVLKCRMVPVDAPADSAVARAALLATNKKAPTALGGVSDLFHVRDVPAVVVGPGTPDQSHQPDESVSILATRQAVSVYVEIVRRTLEEIAG